jgi:hypothetical protein
MELLLFSQLGYALGACCHALCTGWIRVVL